ncbi:MAG: flavodoxin family protein [Prevotella sp.]|nr:flavodoxin family protein [Prevotella sp.]
MSKILILVGSVRRGGNTDLLARAFAKGAREHHDVEIVSVADYKVSPCIGCNSCFVRADHACFQKDDMSEIYGKLRHADVLVIASPVYFYGISAQLKAVIDRLHTPLRNSFPIQRLALLLVGAATLPELFDAIKTQYRLVLNFFHLEDAGILLVRGVKDIGDIQATDALEQAYRLGRSIK